MNYARSSSSEGSSKLYSTSGSARCGADHTVCRCADAPAANDFSVTEEGLPQPPPAEKPPAAAPRLAKVTLVVTEEDGGARVRVRRTLHDIIARQLGVDTPPLPSIRRRRKLALEIAEVRDV